MTGSEATTAKPIDYDLTANLPKKKAICREGHETKYWGEQDMVQCLWRGCHRPIVRIEITDADRTIFDELKADGYYPGRPVGHGATEKPLAEAIASDAEICRQSECSECGHQGLECKPHINDQGDYRPVSVCPECGDAVEF